MALVVVEAASRRFGFEQSRDGSATVIARRIRVTGIVQGVGFRPFVWHLAHQLELVGWVRNDSQGVEIAVQGTESQIQVLVQQIDTNAPPLARVDTVQIHTAQLEDWTGFAIVDSPLHHITPTLTVIGPDGAVCDDCLDELFYPVGRRWRHAFITCTHCGPRYTVSHGLPYDRPQTSMAAFAMCAACMTEYTKPSDRRFHAQTNCCPQCGPQLALKNMQGHAMAGDPIEETLRLLQTGAIVAIKGIGGFHLACDARNPDAVARLRFTKNREAKPLAVVTANGVSLAPYAQVSAQELSLLQRRERPIVLLRSLSACDAALAGVAPGLLWLGVMLPATPIQYLLFHEAAGRPKGSAWLNEPQAMVLVMTSANPGGEPMVQNCPQALASLNGIADAVLDHDRDIVARCDDSVLRVLQEGVQFIRRSRGYAPDAIVLPQTGPAVLAFGAHLKNTICVTQGDTAYLSPHVGDLDNAATCQFLDETVERMIHLQGAQPVLVAHDLHPDDYSTVAALRFASQHGLPTVAVQHHHAHIAAVCAEHGWCDPVLGLALDGFGLGTDGLAWGGELLTVKGAHFERWGHLRPLPMPGKDKAASEPWRMAASVLHELGRTAEIAERFQYPAAVTVASMLQGHFNCPATTSMGRVFDAAAGLLGICSQMQYEAQAAILLEQAAIRHIEVHGWPLAMSDGWVISNQGQLDVRPLLSTLIGTKEIDRAAAQFHACLVAALTDWVIQAAASTGLRAVACGGGCFLNTLLSLKLQHNLMQRGISVMTARRTSPGDASIALGQAWVAAQSVSMSQLWSRQTGRNSYPK